jgi:uncharacterized membrane protein YbhN (UPF0104 family)
MLVDIDPVRYLTAQEAKRARKGALGRWLGFSGLALSVVVATSSGLYVLLLDAAENGWLEVSRDAFVVCLGPFLLWLTGDRLLARNAIFEDEPVHLWRGRFGQGDTARTIDGAAVEFLDHKWLRELDIGDTCTAEVLMMAPILVLDVIDIKRKSERAG